MTLETQYADGSNVYIDDADHIARTIRTSQGAPFSLDTIAHDVEHEFVDVLQQMSGQVVVDNVINPYKLPGGFTASNGIA